MSYCLNSLKGGSLKGGFIGSYRVEGVGFRV